MSNEQEALNLVCTIDDAYAPHCAAMLTSLMAHNAGERIRLFIVHSGLARNTLERMYAHASRLGLQPSFVFLDPAQCASFPVSHHVTVSAYFRLFLPELLPARTRRLVFLDADAIVLGPLAELWHTDLGGAPLAAVRDLKGVAEASRLGLSGRQGYFNSGLMVIDLEQWRARDLTRKSVEYVLRHPERILWWDQDVLNTFFDGEWLPLHPRWNAMTDLWSGESIQQLGGDAEPLGWMQEAKASPRIVHFNGSGNCKPWHCRCTHPYKNEYLRSLQATPWRGMREQGRPTLMRSVSSHARTLWNSVLGGSA